MFPVTAALIGTVGIVPDPFVSRQDLSDRIGRDVTGDDGALACVDAACEMVRTETAQLFNEVTDDTVLLDGNGTDAFFLPEQPVTEIAEVLLDDETVDDFVLHDSGVLVRPWPGIWTLGRGNIEVTYSHGYADEDIPRDVRMVALLIAERLFTQGGGVVFEVLGARQVRYAGAPADLTPSEKAILRAHRVTKQPWATVATS